MKAIYGAYEYSHCIKKLYAFNINGLYRLFGIMQEFLDLKQDGYFVGYVSYEAGLLLQGLDTKLSLHTKIHAKAHAKTPLAYFALYEKRDRLKNKALQEDISESVSGLVLAKDLDYKAYTQAFWRIREHIQKGDVYQINFTQELLAHSNLSPKESFFSLQSQQDTTYKAFIHNAFCDVLCFSPELFFYIKDGKITTQPMKGTIKRASQSLSPEEFRIQDQKLKEHLQNDVKNRSENVMIVDLMRNDLSKIILPHSLEVLDLCVISTYPTLHQMTSSIQGTLLSGTTLLDIFLALFPCGSITGAPKLKSMEIISTLESRPRGVYCGALGLVCQEEISFCVPIRTLVKSADEEVYRYGVGSGVVWDSVCEDEFNELSLKSSFLCAKKMEYDLFETMRYEQGHIFLLYEHMTRLYQSARSLGFKLCAFKHTQPLFSTPPKGFCFMDCVDLEYSQNGLWQGIDELFRLVHLEGVDYLSLPHTSLACILKLVLKHNGTLQVEILPLEPHKSRVVCVDTQPLETFLSRYKSTYRTHFAKAAHKIAQNEIFDMLFCANGLGELSEGSRSNLVCEINSQLFTPFAHNALKGTLREVLLRHHLIEERELHIKDLRNAERIFCLNSVRGAVQVLYSKSVI